RAARSRSSPSQVWRSRPRRPCSRRARRWTRWSGWPRRSPRASRASSWPPRPPIDWRRCVADGDRQFLLSVFLMEAWDTLAAVEDGLATLRSPADPTAVIEHLAVVTHRLRGSAALSGFPQVAGLAAAMEEAVERVAVTPPGADRPSLVALSDMAFWLKTALDSIGETGVEDAEAIAESLAGLVPSKS